jgi:hypothetical protein
LIPRAGLVAVESALTVPPAGLVFSERGVSGLAFAQDIETVAAEEGFGERLETTLGSIGASIRYGIEREEGGTGRSDTES